MIQKQKSVIASANTLRILTSWGGGWRCHKGDQVNFLLDESVYVGHRCKYVGRIDGEDKEVVQ